MQPHDAVRFLLARGLVTPADVVTSRLSVEDVIGRNDNFLIRRGPGQGGYAFKHAAEGEGAARMLRHEAALYLRVSDPDAPPALAALGPFLPRFALFDAEAAVLVTHLAPDTRELWELNATDDALPGMGTALGTALGRCHAIGAELLPEPMRDRRPPWVLGIHRPDPSILRDAWPAQLELIRLVQAHAATCATLDRLQAEWRRQCLVHGDVKLSNILARIGADGDQPSGVILLDWETAAHGDPAWDVGSVFQLMLWHALHLAFNPDDETLPGDPREVFAERLVLYRPELQRFRDAYRDSSTGDSRVMLTRSTEWCGARLIQSAYEEGAALEHPSPFCLALLQLGVNILADAPAAHRDLLHLEEAP